MRLVWILLLAAAGLAAGFLFTRFESDAPRIRTRTAPVYVGAEHIHDFSVDDKGMGVQHVRVWLQAGDQRIELADENYAGGLVGGAELKITRRLEVALNPAKLEIPDGPATLSAEALDFSWYGNRAQVQVPLIIDTKPPRVSLQTGLTYVRRGGSEMVVYSLNEEAPIHGVEIGGHFSAGFPHPSGPRRFVAFYPFPPDTPPGSSPAVVAEDRAGNRTRVRVSISIIERSFPTDRITLSAGFLEQKVPEILPGEHEDLLASYLSINRELRAENAAQIAKLCEQSSEDRLWRGAFLQLPNSSVGARFAEQRTYLYEGQEVDQQTHLGFDFASTAQAEIPAANSGVVSYAEELGIYGKTVIIDHGMGIFSLYGHLSELAVEKGQVVAQEEILGRTGTTGLAGGDHLHFAMLVAGTFVDPDEWIDANWIQEHIEADLATVEGGG